MKVNVNLNLYSALGSHDVLSTVLYSDWFILGQAKLLSFFIHLYSGGATSSQINFLGNIQVCHLMRGSVSVYLPSQPYIYLFSCTHTFRSMAVGHILMVHTFCNVHRLHRHDSTHLGLLMSWGALG